MTQKDKVKELVGRGLNSYHTKSLQQMDRIEKKNKEQNHKISILSNELDNDYLTKTEEGSVVSLEHSKEGMVYLDELQGNTLVNYCTDGSKEMTLNGDIDVEGTNVTLTEGVDNGKVDVMCEGNTLVNLANIKSIYENTNLTSYYADGTICETSLLKLNTAYTLIIEKEFLDGHNMNYKGFELGVGNSINVTNAHPTMTNGSHSMSYNTDKYETKIVTVSFADFKGYKYLTIRPCRRGTAPVEGEVGKYKVKIIFLEGDWTNKEIPQHFEGMKSVGQDDENGHKIEILSAKGKPNLIKNSGFLNGISNYSFHDGSQGEVMNDTSSQSGKILKITTGSSGRVSGPFQPNIVNYIEDKKYTLSGWCKGEPGTTLGIYIERHKSIDVTFTNDDWVRFIVTSEQNPTNWNRTITFYSSNVSKVFYLKNIKVEESDNDTPYIPHISEKNYNSFNGINKKEISLNEPLRRLPNGVKDRLVRIGGKWYIERNCGEIILDGSEEDWVSIHAFSKTNVFRKPLLVAKNTITDYETAVNNFLVDKLPIVKYSTYDTIDAQTVSFSSLFNSTYNGTAIYINRNSSSDLVSFKQWLSENPITVIYELATPIYEPLEVEPTLNTYTDTTHISNNSIIPCNMKIKNSGYNAIIKPSTLYTVALDTNKSGTVGMNLGGAKATTTNNVATITTPATLTDDSLRLYGKGIKGSKIRLLEGDKTNWIPSHFEGMKSSFEDKLQDDGTYRMEILSNNKNVLNLDDIVMKGIGAGCKLDACSTDLIQYTSNQAEWTQIFFMMKLKPFTRYTLSAELQSMNVYVFNDRVGNWDANKYIGAMQNTTNTLKKNQYSFTTNKNGCISIRFTNERMLGVNIAKNIILSEVVGDYTSKKSNKIQFSSIEPLRSVEVSKDRFVFKDGKLMIERNIGAKRLESKYVTGYGGTNTNSETKPNVKIIYFNLPNLKPSWGGLTTLCNKLKTGRIGNGDKTSIEHLYWGTEYDWIGCNDISLPRVGMSIDKTKLSSDDIEGARQYIDNENIELVYQLENPIYEEIPFELQKIILEGYENGTLFFDTNIPPTSIVTYAGETPIVKSVRLNKTEVLNNTNDINDNIIPYLMDMDYRVVCLQLQSENTNNGISMARLFGGTYEMLQRDIQSKRYSIDEYKHRLDAYLGANKITEDEYNKLGDMLNE